MDRLSAKVALKADAALQPFCYPDTIRKHKEAGTLKELWFFSPRLHSSTVLWWWLNLIILISTSSDGRGESVVEGGGEWKALLDPSVRKASFLETYSTNVDLVLPGVSSYMHMHSQDFLTWVPLYSWHNKEQLVIILSKEKTLNVNRNIICLSFTSRSTTPV